MYFRNAETLVYVMYDVNCKYILYNIAWGALYYVLYFVNWATLVLCMRHSLYADQASLG